MARAGVEYDLLTWESDILRLGFWEHAFRLLRDTGAIKKESEGPNKGTWVLPFGSGTVQRDDQAVEDKVLVTTDGVATYTAKDIAYQLWKFDLLDQDFRYRVWSTQLSGRTLWTTCSEGGDESAPLFARAERVINVIDASQSYPQQVVYEGLRRLGFDRQADASEHLAYGLVSLTPASARAVGVEVADAEKTVAMKGRAGVQVFADDLLDRLETLARERGAEGSASPSAIAVGAARYYMLKFSNQQDIVFDFEDALRTTGETGVYLQYAFVRASGILKRAGTSASAMAPAEIPEPDRALVLRMADYPRLMATSAVERSPSVLAKFAFELAATFSSFYDNTTPVVAEPDAALKDWRVSLVAAFRGVLGDLLSVLGIPAPEQI
jgi:arginyl-tRNA synthetase